jgi:hypothetical protein
MVNQEQKDQEASSQEIEAFDKDKNQTTPYDSNHEAARALNIKQ